MGRGGCGRFGAARAGRETTGAAMAGTVAIVAGDSAGAGVAAAARDSAGAAVTAAARAIRRGGLRGVGVADIMKEAGLTHGGFYAHFESRDALLVEAMQRAGQDNLVSLSDGIERRLRQGGTRFRALVETYLNDAHIEWTEDGCVIAALASEMTRQHEAVRDEARRRISAMVPPVRAAPPTCASVSDAAVGASQLVGACTPGSTPGAHTVWR